MIDMDEVRENHHNERYFDNDVIGELLTEMHTRGLMASVLISYADSLMGLVVATAHNLDATAARQVLDAAEKCRRQHNLAMHVIAQGEKDGEL